MFKKTLLLGMFALQIVALSASTRADDPLPECDPCKLTLARADDPLPECDPCKPSVTRADDPLPECDPCKS